MKSHILYITTTSTLLDYLVCFDANMLVSLKSIQPDRVNAGCVHSRPPMHPLTHVTNHSNSPNQTNYIQMSKQQGA